MSERTDLRAAAAKRRRTIPGLDRLAALLAAAPLPEVHYRVIDGGEAGRMLEPHEDLAQFDGRWRRIFPQTKPALTATQHDFTGMWDKPGPWRDLLEACPLGWHSFEVLDDLTMAVDSLQTMGADTTIVEPMLERAAALLRTVLDAGVSGNGTFQWRWQENRPALRMLAHLALRALDAMDRSASCGRFIELAERLIRLNPMDHHDIREPLTRAYLMEGEPAKVLALTDRYPDDGFGTSLNRILALLRLGRRGEALIALDDVGRDHRVAIDMLLARTPRRPRSKSGSGIAVGDTEEAREYRRATRALWEQDNALAWLGAAWREVRKKAPKRR
jgi:hypothetical protein